MFYSQLKRRAMSWKKTSYNSFQKALSQVSTAFSCKLYFSGFTKLYDYGSFVDDNITKYYLVLEMMGRSLKQILAMYEHPKLHVRQSCAIGL